MEAEETSTVEPETAGPEREDAVPAGSAEPLAVGNGSQVIAVTINLNLPIFGSVVYAARRSIPPAVGGRIFDVVRRVVGGPVPVPERAAEPRETARAEPDGAVPTGPSG